MTDRSQPTGSHDDLVQPFQIEVSRLRGRLIRLGPVLDHILTRHDYPEPVTRLLGECVVMAVTLASALKYDGIFTLQASGEGPVRTLVADVTSTGDVRGYARVRSETPIPEGAEGASLLGRGTMAFTVDQGSHTERYQGIVSLTGDTLADSARHYFEQSDQLQTGLKLAVDKVNGDWRGGSLMLQRLPDNQPILVGVDREEDWNRALILMESATLPELVDPALSAHTLLIRLFHEDGVRAFPASPLAANCRCSRDRMLRALSTLPRHDLRALRDDGETEITCEFCNSVYRLDATALEALVGDERNGSE